MPGMLVALAAILQAHSSDSATLARDRAALIAFESSVGAVTAAAAAFRTDLSGASRDLVIARADRLLKLCTRAADQGARLDLLLGARGAPVREALAALSRDLKRCAADFATGPGYRGVDSVKAWAPYRLSRLDEAVRRYRLAAYPLMRERRRR